MAHQFNFDYNTWASPGPNFLHNTPRFKEPSSLPRSPEPSCISFETLPTNEVSQDNRDQGLTPEEPITILSDVETDEDEVSDTDFAHLEGRHSTCLQRSPLADVLPTLTELMRSDQRDSEGFGSSQTPAHVAAVNHTVDLDRSANTNEHSEDEASHHQVVLSPSHLSGELGLSPPPSPFEDTPENADDEARSTGQDSDKRIALGVDADDSSQPRVSVSSPTLIEGAARDENESSLPVIDHPQDLAVTVPITPGSCTHSSSPTTATEHKSQKDDELLESSLAWPAAEIQKLSSDSHPSDDVDVSSCQPEGSPVGFVDHDSAETDDDEPPLKRRRTRRWRSNAETVQDDSPRARSKVSPARKAEMDSVSQPAPGATKDPETIAATYEEWTGSVKLVTIGGVTTFQGQYDGKLSARLCCALLQMMQATQVDGSCEKEQSQENPGKRKKGKRELFTSEENALLIKLKSNSKLSWRDIHKRFDTQFPGRSIASLQVHFSTQLKGRNSL